MATKPFDQFNKRLFQELLSPFGQVTPNFAVPGEERAIAIFFVPDGSCSLDSGDGFYRLAPRLRTTIVALAESPNTPDTLWLRLLGCGRTQEDAITEVLLLPESDPKRSSALSLLVLMALSQAYQE